MKKETRLTFVRWGRSKNQIRDAHRESSSEPNIKFGLSLLDSHSQKTIQIGTSDFRELIEGNNYY